jgi:CRISPR system Cascade subunit CasB
MSTSKPADSKSSASQIGSVIRAVNILSDSPGDLAALRRMQPETPDSAAFWSIAVRSFAEGELTPHGDARLPRWAAFIQALAQLSGLVLSDPEHRPSFGAALADAGYSEARLLRLIRAEPPILFDEVRTAAHQLAQKGIRLNPFDLGRLLVLQPGAGAEAARRRVAHDYYRQLHHHTSSSHTSES